MEDAAKKGAILYELWEMVHKLHHIYDFDSTMSADELIEDLKNIIKMYIQ